MCEPISSNDPGIQTEIVKTTATLLSKNIDISCNLLYSECVNVDNIDPSGCGKGGIINRRNVIIAYNNFNLQRKFSNIYRADLFTVDSDNSKRQAGGKFITVFPSYCQNCNGFSKINNPNYPDCNNNITLEENLLNKKAYMFRNRSNNVLSGPIINYTDKGIQSAALFGGNTGTGLTRNQQLANMGRGFLPNGRKGLRFGVQSLQGISLYSNSNIYNNAPKGFYGRTVTKPSPFNDRRFINRNIPVKISICQK